MTTSESTMSVTVAIREAMTCARRLASGLMKRR